MAPGIFASAACIVMTFAALGLAAPAATAVECEYVRVGDIETGACVTSLLCNSSEDVCEVSDCEPAGVQTVYIVDAEHSGGLLDSVMVSVLCGGTVVANCTAEGLNNPCQDSGLSVPGQLECQARVIDQPDLVTMTGAKASCRDPADPYKLIPATFIYE